MTHHNTVLMRDTHAGLAPVLEEIRSVNPNMHHHHTARATRERPSGRGEAGGEGVEVGFSERGEMKGNGSNARPQQRDERRGFPP